MSAPPDHDSMHGQRASGDQPPGEQGGGDGQGAGFLKYGAGYGLSIVLTLASFWVAGGTAVWPAGVPVMLAALAVSQMGVHLLFFLHVTSGEEGTNNILALAFGIFVVGLVVFGSMMIIGQLDAHMMTGDTSMRMQP